MGLNAANWLEIVSDFGPVITGGAVAYVAWQQLQISRKTRISQRYERTIGNYHKLLEAQTKIACHNYQEIPNALKELREIRDEAQLCLSQEVVDCVQDILDRVIAIDEQRAKAQSSSSDDEKKGFIEEAFRLAVELGYEQPWQVYRKSLKID